jgi:oxygen-dependent protoporphyrinogen oxidase
MEDTYGGLLKGMLAMRKAASARGQAGPASAGPGGVLTSFREGLEELIRGLTERLSPSVLTGVRATGLRRRDGGWDVAAGDRVFPAELVVLAVPAYDASNLLKPLDPGLASTMETIPYTAMAVVHLGFREADLPRPLDGFGFLIPHAEGRRILGSLWASSIFAGRAPGGHVLLTVMTGGAKDAFTPRLPDAELLSVVRGELRHTMGIQADPAFARIIHWEKAIPQYTYGHPTRVASLEKRFADHPGLILTGNAFRGISVPDCVTSSQRIAPEALAWLKGRPGKT